MKKLLILAAWLLLGAGAIAAPVSEQQALKVASRFWATLGTSNFEQPQWDNITARTGLNHMYVFDLHNGNGFVIVAADDVARPILGYSTSNHFGTKPSPEALYWLHGMESEIAEAIEQSATPSADTKALWSMYGTKSPVLRKTKEAVAPLVSTQWNQSPLYNALCPVDENAGSGHPPAGCVATAMAQVLKYWNHPVTGTGSHSYNHPTYGLQTANFGATTYQWDSMPNQLSYYNTNGEIEAVATLMYHCGVAVDMNYGTNSSGAMTAANGNPNSTCAENAMLWYFGYSHSIHTTSRGTMNDAEWALLLKSDIDQQRPILYSGRDYSGGHAFICDGYDNNNYFHFNWGWGGYCDGYYPLSALNPAPGGTGGNATYTFNMQQNTIMGITPYSGSDSVCTITVVSNDNTMGTVAGGGTYTPGTNITLSATAAEGYRFAYWNDGGSANPRNVYTEHSQTFTAVFQPVDGDTLRYDNGFYLTSFQIDGTPNTWAVRFAPNTIANGKYLVAASLYNPYDNNSYKVYAYQGGDSIPQQLIDSTFVNYAPNAWLTLPFINTLQVDTTQSLWLVAQSDGQYPAASSFYAGTPNSNFIRENGQWLSLNDYNYHYSFMLRAITTYVPNTTFAVVANPQADYMGRVEGAGVYANYSDAHLLAHAYEGYRFVGWSDGVLSNPRDVNVTANINLTALYATMDADTLQSDVDDWIFNYGFDTPQYTHWAVVYAPSEYATHNHVYAVQLFITEPGTYNVEVNSGSGCYGSITVGQQDPQWYTIPLNMPLPLNHTDPLWIDISTSNSAYPIACSSYSGRPDRSYFYTDNGYLLSVTENGYYCSWKVRALVDDEPMGSHTLNAVADDSSHGHVDGSGTYAEGAFVNVLAHAEPGWRFTHWNDDPTYIFNPYYFNLTTDLTMTAHYVPVNADTLRYDQGDYCYNWGFGDGISTSWAVKFLPGDLVGHNLLRSVMFCYQQPSTYNIQIHQGEYITSQSLKASGTITTHGNIEWVTYTFDSPVHIDTSLPLWIVLQTERVAYAGTGTYYGGSPNSCYFMNSNSHEWFSLTEMGQHFSWMIRGIMDYEEVGIEHATADDSKHHVYTDDGAIVVDNAQGCRILITDVLGRPVAQATSYDAVYRLRPTATGVYYVKVNDEPAQKVVIVR